MGQQQTIQMIGEVSPCDEGFEIVLEKKYRDGLTGLEGFSHALVLWWASEADSLELRNRLIYTAPYTNNPHDVGVFGSRSPSRPNPIGLSVIYLQQIDQANVRLVTPYIDTEPGTPVVDVKPYFPASDRLRDVAVPGWCEHWPKFMEDSASFDWEAEFNGP